MSIKEENFNISIKQFQIDEFQVSTDMVLKAVVATNNYLVNLDNECKKLNVKFFDALGQRNLSGFIGEVYKKFLADNLEIIKLNPHPDGRPDLIFYKSHDYYNSGFQEVGGKLIPNKTYFTPYNYGGIEIKCTLGTHSIPKKDKIERNNKPFEIYEPRVNYLKGVTYMAHHSHNINLLGLYYDYYQGSNCCPQILTGFFSKIEKEDWGKVSKPKANTKTTSATSISKSGIEKLTRNCLFHINDMKYINSFKKAGFYIID